MLSISEAALVSGVPYRESVRALAALRQYRLLPRSVKDRMAVSAVRGSSRNWQSVVEPLTSEELATFHRVLSAARELDAVQQVPAEAACEARRIVREAHWAARVGACAMLRGLAARRQR